MVADFDMKGKAVIVTGGARGVGRGITECFLEAGADVVICGRNEPAELPAALADVRSDATATDWCLCGVEGAALRLIGSGSVGVTNPIPNPKPT